MSGDKTEAITSKDNILTEIMPGSETEMNLLIKFIAKISEGGMGSVWHAKIVSDVEHDIAIKIAKEGFTDELKREAKFVERLDYRTIAKLLMLGKVFGREAFFMEYINGRNFYEIIQIHNSLGYLFPEKFAGFVGWLGAEALNYGHNLAAIDEEGKIRIGIIHGDFSPQNIIAQNSGGIMIVDYGTSRVSGENKPQVLAGKLPYMAPELFEGADISFSSDIYALGATLYHIMLGEPLLNIPKSITKKTDAVSYAQEKHKKGELEKKVETTMIESGIITKKLAESVYMMLRKEPDKRCYGAGRESIKQRELALVVKSCLTDYLYHEGFGPTQEALGEYLGIISKIKDGRTIEEEEMTRAKLSMPFLFEEGTLKIKKKPKM